MINKKLLAFLYLTMIPSLFFAQMEAPENWFNLAKDVDGVYGAETEKAYTLLSGRTAKPVIVAVIDSGVDWEHEDLDDVMWVNEDEIPNNNIDDDNNGYVDDIHGWNFIGGKDGRNVGADNLEVTRLYRKYHKEYKDVNPLKLEGNRKIEYAKYLKYKRAVRNNKEKAEKSLDNLMERKSSLMNAVESIAKKVKKPSISLKALENIDVSDDTGLAFGVNVLKNFLAQSEDDKINFENVKSELKESFQRGIDYYTNQVESYYNPDFNPRDIVGDNYDDPYEIGYGNNDYEGPDAFHGTHVAGIIAAERDNDLGMKGVADNVKIMTVRAVPDGDERDKDVANAIRYAVDNGAKVVNMSFGKGFSWNKKVVDEAVKYAADNDVLLVHAAGNSAMNNDENDNFPNDGYEKACFFCSKKAKNWIEVGALNFSTDETLPAPFSNYGKKQVDLFAPGMAIYSTIPDNKYRDAQGTSMAAPVVAGVAALIRSYFPDLSAKQTKKILMKSVTPIEIAVAVPGQEDMKLDFDEISVSGGVVNAYEAVKMALKK